MTINEAIDAVIADLASKTWVPRDPWQSQNETCLYVSFAKVCSRIYSIEDYRALNQRVISRLPPEAITSVINFNDHMCKSKGDVIAFLESCKD
jgi:hypothetical protein